MTRSVPQLLSLAAIVAGVALFAYTLYHIDLAEIAASAGRLGLALPLILLPSTAWQLLRTWGWAVAFPADTRPSFTRLFRVRLAADALSFFTVRGVVGEPLKLVLLYDRLVVPVATEQPDRDELGYWNVQGWAPDLQSRRLEQLGDLAIRRPWDVERRALFRSRMDELRESSGSQVVVRTR